MTDDVFVAGDVARFPHPIYGYQIMALEHWRNALIQAEIAAHNMISAEADRRPHVSVPWFWSIQFERQHQVGRRAQPWPTRWS